MAAHDLLAEHYQRRAVEAEAAHDDDALAEYTALLRSHDRGQHTAWLAGQGTVSLQTEPVAELVLHRVVEQTRRWVLDDGVPLGPSPIRDLAVDHGSYVIMAHRADTPPIPIPAFVERNQAWTAGPPDDPDRPVRLPLPGSLAPDEVFVPAGWCVIGGDPRALDAHPRRRIWIDGFVMTRFAITNRQFIAFLNDLVARGRAEDAVHCAPREHAGVADGDRLIFTQRPDARFEVGQERSGTVRGLDEPTVDVSWHGACAYAQWRSARDGCDWRLPHELEWEKAARGVDGRSLPWGAFFEPTWASSLHATAGQPGRVAVDTHPIDCSVYGVRGMAGNARDWCLNQFHAPLPDHELSVYAPATDDDFRAVRGGSMVSHASACCAASRFGARPSHRRSSVGFRLVRLS